MSVLDNNILDAADYKADLYLRWKAEGDKMYGQIGEIYEWLRDHSPTYKNVVEEKFFEPAYLGEYYDPTELEKEYGKIHTQYTIRPIVQTIFFMSESKTDPNNPLPPSALKAYSKTLSAFAYEFRDNMGVDRQIRLYNWMAISGVTKWPDWLVDTATWTFKPPFNSLEIILERCAWGGEYNERVKSSIDEQMFFDI